VNRHVITKYGDRCLVLEAASFVVPHALVRRERDGAEFRVYFEDLKGGCSASRCAFYGLGSTGKDEFVRMNRKLREMRLANNWNVVR
jgi:hypothetical protein